MLIEKERRQYFGIEFVIMIADWVQHSLIHSPARRCDVPGSGLGMGGKGQRTGLLNRFGE